MKEWRMENGEWRMENGKDDGLQDGIKGRNRMGDGMKQWSAG